MRGLVRSASLSNYVAVARSVGLDPYRLLAAAGIDRACVLDPDLRIPTDALRWLFEASARASGADDFGLRIARTRQLSTLGPLGLVIREQPTLRAALETLSRYMRLHNESLDVRLDVHGPSTWIVQDLGAAGNGLRQSVELAVAMSLRVIQALVGSDWRPQRVTFVHSRPASLATHLQSFGAAPIEFLAPCNGLVCRSADLLRPLPAADPALARYARQYVESLAERSAGSFAGQVRQLALALLPAGQCSIERVAATLSVDRRTVHRRLQADGTTFSAIVDGVRDEIARHHVAAGGRSLTDIAEMLGFAGLSAFSRWFRQRHGCSATAFRAAGAARSPVQGPGQGHGVG